MKCPQCGSGDVDRLDGTLVCTQCGHVLGESEIVNDVTFGETSAGAATVQGTQVNASGRHSMVGPGGRKYGDGDGRAVTMMRADTEIRGLCRRLGVESVQLHQTASRIYQLALNIGQGATPFLHPVTNQVDTEGGTMIPGRKSEYSYGACVYLALRRAKVPIMLIEVADAVKANVFVLGRAYLRLTSLLRFDPEQRDLSLADPSLYIRRFAKMLDFGEEEDKVILDATRLCTRFKNDWLVQGRRPSGITGACLLIAARMNNFRRSVAEIVQVVKVADTTLKRRLDEFRDTKAGSMSIAEFREMWDTPADDNVLPPSAVRNRKREAEEKLKKEEMGTDDENDNSEAEYDEEEVNDPATQQDSAHKPVPVLAPVPAPVPIGVGGGDNEELEEQFDGAIAGEVQQFLDSNLLRSDLDQAIEAQDARERRARMTADERAREELAKGSQVTAVGGNPAAQAGPSQTQTTVVPSQASEAERPRKRRRRHRKHRVPEEEGDPFAGLDEEELDGYLLDEEEQAIKERVWTEFNKEYLQQALIKAIKEEEDLKHGLPPTKAMRRRQGRVVRDAANAMGSSAADAATKMVQARRFSQKINYAALGDLFPGSSSDHKKRKGKHRASNGEADVEAEAEATAEAGLVDDPDGLGAAMDYVDGHDFAGDDLGELSADHPLRADARAGAPTVRAGAGTRHTSVGLALSEGEGGGASDGEGLAGVGDTAYDERADDAQWNELDE